MLLFRFIGGEVGSAKSRSVHSAFVRAHIMALAPLRATEKIVFVWTMLDIPAPRIAKAFAPTSAPEVLQHQGTCMLNEGVAADWLAAMARRNCHIMGSAVVARTAMT